MLAQVPVPVPGALLPSRPSKHLVDVRLVLLDCSVPTESRVRTIRDRSTPGASWAWHVLDTRGSDLRHCLVLPHHDARAELPLGEAQRRPRRRSVVAVSALVAGRALGGHVTLPLLVVVRGLPFLALVLVRPNEATLAIGGAQASAGRLPWTLLFIAAVVGAVASDALSYTLGRTAGEAALHRLMSRGRRHGRLGRIVERSRSLVGRHGVLAVAAARPTVITHGVVPVLAGVARLPAPRFVVASMTGAAIWAAVWLGGAAVVTDALRAGDRQIIVIGVSMAAAGAALAVRECLRRPACLRHVA